MPCGTLLPLTGLSLYYSCGPKRKILTLPPLDAETIEQQEQQEGLFSENRNEAIYNENYIQHYNTNILIKEFMFIF